MKQLPLTDYARMLQWILKYTKNTKVHSWHSCLQCFDTVVWATFGL